MQFVSLPKPAPGDSRQFPDISPTAPGLGNPNPLQPRSRCHFKGGRGGRGRQGGGAAPGAARGRSPEPPPDPAAPEDADPKAEAWTASGRRPSRSRGLGGGQSPRGSRAKPRLRAPLGARSRFRAEAELLRARSTGTRACLVKSGSASPLRVRGGGSGRDGRRLPGRRPARSEHETRSPTLAFLRGEESGARDQSRATP